MFEPGLISSEMEEGLHNSVHASIMKCGENTHAALCKNIVLSGGSSMFQNFAQRLEMELKKLFPKEREITVVAPPERKYSSWLGGSILSSYSNFSREMIVTKAEYEEHGVKIVHQKCT